MMNAVHLSPIIATPIQRSRPSDWGMANGESCKGSDIHNPSSMVTIGEGGCFFPPWNGARGPAEEYRHSKYLDHPWNITFADRHAAFTRILLTNGVQLMFTANYTFDPTK